MAAVLVVAGIRLLEDGVARAIGADGHVVHLVANADDAAIVARAHAPDAVVVDEGVGGRPSSAIMATLDVRPPVAVVVSEWSTVASFRRSASAGFNLHVVRPCAARTIADALSLMLRLHDDGMFRPGTFDVIRFGAMFPGARQFGTG